MTFFYKDRRIFKVRRADAWERSAVTKILFAIRRILVYN